MGMLEPFVRGALYPQAGETMDGVVWNSSICEMVGMVRGMSILRGYFCPLLVDMTCRRQHRTVVVKNQLSPDEADDVVEKENLAHTRNSSLF